MFVRCPKRDGFTGKAQVVNRMMNACKACEHHKGVDEQGRVMCAYPTKISSGNMGRKPKYGD